MKNTENHFENSDIEFWLEDGILHGSIKKDVVITTDNAKVMVEARLKLCKGISYPMFTDFRNLKSIDKSARSYLSKGESVMLITAGAFLIKNVTQEVIANFFIHFDRPKVPTKFFTSKEKALKWLEPFKKEK
ncbi:MAG TPA: hypothetical protein VF691_19180 [Cytophagaceae bacterium]|jgi:6-pyruvoyl-tetrahydropterin synthase